MATYDINQKFNKLTILSFKNSIRPKGDIKRIAVCKCDCGNIVEVEKYNLGNGNTTQCNQCAKKSRGLNRRTHGHSCCTDASKLSHKAYYTWQAMKRRCCNPKDKRYDKYGGRGITVCDEWINSYENFLRDVGLPPSKDHSIDRIDVNGNYEPNNVRWATQIEQANNKTNTHFITAFGKTQTLAQWSKELNIQRETIRNRIKKGYTPEMSLTKGKIVNRIYVNPYGRFNSLAEAGKSVGLKTTATHSRFNSDKYSDWYIIEIDNKAD